MLYFSLSVGSEMKSGLVPACPESSTAVEDAARGRCGAGESPRPAARGAGFWQAVEMVLLCGNRDVPRAEKPARDSPPAELRAQKHPDRGTRDAAWPRLVQLPALVIPSRHGRAAAGPEGWERGEDGCSTAPPGLGGQRAAGDSNACSIFPGR